MSSHASRGRDTAAHRTDTTERGRPPNAEGHMTEEYRRAESAVAESGSGRHGHTASEGQET